jgi:hypothetical protein
MEYDRKARDTLTPFELDNGDTLRFTLANGSERCIELLDSGAEVFRTTLKQRGVEEVAGRTDYRFWCDLNVDGERHRLEREISTQNSFYEPWEIRGMTIWFDAVRAIGAFCSESHGEGHPLPKRDARFAVQDASLRICPEVLHPWCPLPEGGLRIEQCYRGEDCYFGAYHGVAIHYGLDINHPRGTPLWAPIDFDDQYYFGSLVTGANNNRWVGIRGWDNGMVWKLQAHHMTRLTVPEHTPLKRGQQFADGAGVLSGVVDHSHFVFRVVDEGEEFILDPWILFRQMYLDG